MESINYVHPNNIEGLSDLPENFILPSHFLCLILGRPGSGKTNLMKFILKEKLLLFKKYDNIFIVTPSQIEYNDLFLPSENFNSELNFEWIYKMIKGVKCDTYKNVLLILDDVVANLKNESTNMELLKLAFNRRHILNNVSIFKYLK